MTTTHIYVMIMSIIAFLTMDQLNTVLSACSNGCSGHGVCGKYDLCYCYQDAYGNDVWTGADCSLKTCPK